MLSYLIFFFNDTATTEIYTLSLHDALPILNNIEKYLYNKVSIFYCKRYKKNKDEPLFQDLSNEIFERSEEHTSELQSRQYLVCRLLLEKKKKPTNYFNHTQYKKTNTPY